MNEPNKNMLLEILSSPQTVSRLRDIAAQHNMKTETLELFGAEAAKMLLGETPQDQFARQLAVKLVITEEHATAIANDVRSRILIPLQKSGTEENRSSKEGTQEDRVDQADSSQNVPHVVTRQESDAQQTSQTIGVPRYTNESVGDNKNTDAIDQQGKRYEEKKRSFSNDPYREPLE